MAWHGSFSFVSKANPTPSPTPTAPSTGPATLQQHQCRARNLKRTNEASAKHKPHAVVSTVAKPMTQPPTATGAPTQICTMPLPCRALAWHGLGLGMRRQQKKDRCRHLDLEKKDLDVGTAGRHVCLPQLPRCSSYVSVHGRTRQQEG